MIRLKRIVAFGAPSLALAPAIWACSQGHESSPARGDDWSVVGGSAAAEETPAQACGPVVAPAALTNSACNVLGGPVPATQVTAFTVPRGGLSSTWYHGTEGSVTYPIAAALAQNKRGGTTALFAPPLQNGLIPDMNPGNNVAAPNGGGKALPAGVTALPIGVAVYEPNPNDPGVAGGTGALAGRVPFSTSARLGANCSMCHTRLASYRGSAIIIDGAGSAVDATKFFVDLFTEGSLEALPGSLGFGVMYTRLIGMGYTDAEAKSVCSTVVTLGVAAVSRPAPSSVTPEMNGRLDDFGRAREGLYLAWPGDPTVLFGDDVGNTNQIALAAPVDAPWLWGFKALDWLHYNANTNSTLQRNVGQAIGTGATPLTVTLRAVQTNLTALETAAENMTALAWPRASLGVPAPVPAKVTLGATIFAASCSGCHGNATGNMRDVGTDASYNTEFSLDVYGTDGNGSLDTGPNQMADPNPLPFYRVTASLLQSVAPENAAIWRNPNQNGNNAYMARPLTGIWATAPYLHNGSVPTLYDLLRSPADRPATVNRGSTEFDPVMVGWSQTCADGNAGDTTSTGNTNVGHAYGPASATYRVSPCGTVEGDRQALLEYLKTL